MPTYDFYCKECLHDWEVFLPMSKIDEPISNPCPNCSKVGSIERIVCSPGIHFRFMGSTIQSHAPEGFKEVLRTMKKNHPKAKGIEV